jgi:hypothetical protein
MGKAGLPKSPIQFRKLWNCCWGNETHVITFDCGSRHAVCSKCAAQYTRQNGPDWAADLLADCADADIEVVGILDPDEQHGIPCYVGPIARVHEQIRPGVYPSVDMLSDEMQLCTVVVGTDKSYAIRGEDK